MGCGSGVEGCDRDGWRTVEVAEGISGGVGLDGAFLLGQGALLGILRGRLSCEAG